MWGSFYNVAEAIFYLIKWDYNITWHAFCKYVKYVVCTVEMLGGGAIRELMLSLAFFNCCYYTWHARLLHSKVSVSLGPITQKGRALGPNYYEIFNT